VYISIGADGALRKHLQMLNCVDLFSGAGGFSLAATQAGLRVRLAIENNKHAVQTYRDNLCQSAPRPLVIDQDITSINACKAYRDVFPNGEQCDLMLGGPPCQGFSTHRINDAGVDDRRNDLIHVYFDFVRAFSPSVFLMENVPGMLWDRHAFALRRFYREGALAGYDVNEAIIVDARDFGLPQRRKRVFILGIRRGIDTSALAWPPRTTHGSDVARRGNPRLLPWVDCTSAFRAAPPGDANDVHMSHSQELVDAFRKTPANGGSRKDSGRVLDCHKNHDGHKDVYGRIDPGKPAPTMTTACINPSKGRFVHPVEHHGITVRQAARIQTFPDAFTFSGGLIAAGQQVGNAVPVELGRQLIAHLIPLLERGRVSEERDEQPALPKSAKAAIA
jgi:DNA (cytosine-5)-methyltransferase 1